MRKVLLPLIIFTGFLFGQTPIPIDSVQSWSEVGTGNDCYPSVLDGGTVTVTGFITAVAENGTFYIQDDTEILSGVYVYDQDQTFAEGDSVTFSATVDEYYGWTELKNVSNETVHSTGNTIFAPVAVTTGDLGGGCSEQGENYENMLIKLTNVTVTKTKNSYGEWYVDDGSGECQIDDQFFAITPRVGDVFEEIVGVVDYSFSNYAVNPRRLTDFTTDSFRPELKKVTISPTAPDTMEVVSVTVEAIDDRAGYGATLFTMIDGASVYTPTAMTDNGDSTFTGEIPGQVDETSASFYVDVIDSDSNWVSTDTLKVTWNEKLIPTAIKDIQMTADSLPGDSPLKGQLVNIAGVVTAEFWGSSKNRYLYVQDAEGPWNGILVFNSSGWNTFDISASGGIVHSIAEGDSVLIQGVVDEYFGMTQLKDVTKFFNLGPAENMIKPDLVSVADVKTGGAKAEAYEGCLIKLEGVHVGNPDLGNGEWALTDGTTDSVYVDDTWSYYYWPKIAEEFKEVIGVLDFTFSNTKLQPRLARDVVEKYVTRAQRINQVLYSDLLKVGKDNVSDQSYYLGKDTLTVEGVVTVATDLAYAGSGIKLTLEDIHGGPWSGLICYSPDSTALGFQPIGRKVKLTGVVAEYGSSTYDGNVTEIDLTEPVQVLGLISPENMPRDTISSGDLRDPLTGEQWGGVWVTITNATVMQNDLDFEQWTIDDGTGEIKIGTNSIAPEFDTFERPPVGTFITSVSGWVYNRHGYYSDSTAYKLEPNYPSDIVITAPNISSVTRSPVAPDGDDVVTVTASISDNSSVVSADLYYSINEGAYVKVPMSNTSGATWTGDIPATSEEGAEVVYFIEAFDDGVDQDGVINNNIAPALDTSMVQFGYHTVELLTIEEVQKTRFAQSDSYYKGYTVSLSGLVNNFDAANYSLHQGSGPWSGIWINSTLPDGDTLATGDSVNITGTIAENFGQTELTSVTAFTILSSGKTLKYMNITPSGMTETENTFNGAESYEGSLVSFNNLLLEKVNQYDWTAVDAAGNEILVANDYADEELQTFMDGLVEGDSLLMVRGTVFYSYGTYKVQLNGIADMTTLGITEGSLQPKEFALHNNYPNPFNPATMIRFDLARSTHVNLVIYDLMGRTVRTLVSSSMPGGRHQILWNGRNEAGKLVGSGMYIYRISTPEFSASNKMLLIR